MFSWPERHDGRGATGALGWRPLIAAVAMLLSGLSVVVAAGVADAAATGRAYVTNRDADTVSVVDLATNAVVHTIPVGDEPLAVAVTTDGAVAFVVNQASDSVSVIDPITYTVTGTVTVGDAPTAVAVSPTGVRAYVTNFSSNTVSVVDTATRSVVATVPVGASPSGVTVAPDGSRVYVTNFSSRSVSVIDPLTNAVVATIPVGSLPTDVAVKPTGSRAYVVNSATLGGGISVVDTATNAVVRTIPIGGSPRNVAFSPNGTRAYVTVNFAGIAVLDTSTDTIVATIPSGPFPGVPGAPHEVAISPDGTHGLVTTAGSDRVAVFDTSSNRVFTSFVSGAGAIALATSVAPPRQPRITLATTANPDSGPAPLSVTYTHAVANDGTDVLFQVSVSDGGCSPPTLQGGDTDADMLLDPGETWTFRCHRTHSLAGTRTTTASAQGTSTITGLSVSSGPVETTVTAEGAGGQPTLSGTSLVGSFTTTSFRCFPVRFGYQAAGEVATTSGSYHPGTFTQTGSVSASGGFFATFVIQTATGTRIEGRASGPVNGGCARGGSTNVFSTSPTGTPSGTYEATITTATGARFSDAGAAFASFAGQAPQEQNLAGQSRLSFFSQQAAAQPIDVAPSFTASSPPASATVGGAYGPYTFAATGDPAPTFAVASGSLPTGLSLGSSTGVLSGTPTAAGAFTFTVRASNAVGPGAVSSAITITVAPAVPGPPTGVAATAANGQATVTWSAPAADGGSPVTGYTVTGSPGPRTCSTTGALACTVTGLTKGTSYTFTVVATNAAGSSPTSAPSNAVVPTDGLGFQSLTPARILDSRAAGPQVGPYGSPWATGQSRDVAVTGTGGVPASAAAVTLNVTVTGTTAAGFLTVWPAGEAMPVASSLNWASGQTIANAVTVKVGALGMVSVFNQTGSADVVVDVVGYYVANAGNGFTSLAPARILDSRPAGPQAGPYGTPWGPGQVREVTVAGVGGVPAGADAVVLNVTATGTTTSGFLTVWPAGQAQPLASSLNWASGQTIPNALTVKVGAGGRISVFNQSGRADVIVDVIGSFTSGSGQLFHPLSPVRIQDSRPAGPPVGPYSTPWGPGVSRTVQVTGAGGVPAGAGAVLLNVTATGTTATSYLRVWPAGQAAPLASSLNWGAGETMANSVTGKLGATGAISVSNDAGEVHVLADVAGWYG